MRYATARQRTRKQAEYNKYVFNRVNELAGNTGKIDWNIVIFLFNNGTDRDTAVYSVLDEQVRTGIIKTYKTEG